MHFLDRRPSVDTAQPDIRVFAFADATHCTFYLDLCGEALFKRGWRTDKGEAPLKENLASGFLLLAGWNAETPLVDPFCGSGTIAIEAALAACGVAPGLKRRFLFENFSGFEQDIWQEEIEEAIGLDCTDALPVSAKTGLGVDAVLEAIVNRLPAPGGDLDAPLKALIFDSWYDSYQGVVVLFRVVDGRVKLGDMLRHMSTG